MNTMIKTPRAAARTLYLLQVRIATMTQSNHGAVATDISLSRLPPREMAKATEAYKSQRQQIRNAAFFGATA
jgi:hypothetical protein